MKFKDCNDIENTLLTFFIEHPFQIYSVQKIAEYCGLPELIIIPILGSLEYNHKIYKIDGGYRLDMTNQRIYKLLEQVLEQISKDNVILYPFRECKTCEYFMIPNKEKCIKCESKAPTEWVRYKPEGEQ